MNPLTLLPTWEARAHHMDRVAEECERRGMARTAEFARINAASFRMLEEMGEDPRVYEGGADD